MGWVWYNGGMTKMLKEALEEVSMLPEKDQENIGRGLLSHLEKLRKLRIEIDKGLNSGEVKEFDIESLIQEKTHYGGR